MQMFFFLALVSDLDFHSCREIGLLAEVLQNGIPAEFNFLENLGIWLKYYCRSGSFARSYFFNLSIRREVLSLQFQARILSSVYEYQPGFLCRRLQPGPCSMGAKSRKYSWRTRPSPHRVNCPQLPKLNGGAPQLQSSRCTFLGVSGQAQVPPGHKYLWQYKTPHSPRLERFVFWLIF